MAAAIWYVRRTTSGDTTTPLIDGLQTAIVNEDDATLEADVLVAANAAAQAAGYNVPDDYFDSAVLALTALGTDADTVYIDSGHEPNEVIA